MMMMMMMSKCICQHQSMSMNIILVMQSLSVSKSDLKSTVTGRLLTFVILFMINAFIIICWTFNTSMGGVMSEQEATDCSWSMMWTRSSPICCIVGNV